MLVPTPRASRSLVPPLPVHPQDKLQPVRNRRLKVLILRGGRWIVKRLEWRTRAQEMRNEVRFRNLSRSHGVPSSELLLHVFDVGRCPCTWRFGTHGMVPCSIILKDLRWLTQPHQTSQPQECPPYVSISCGSRYGQSRLHHSHRMYFVRISLSFIVFVSRVLKSSLFL